MSDTWTQSSPFGKMPMTAEGEELMRVFGDLYEELHERISQELPHSRYRSLALTELEASYAWIARAVMSTCPNRDPEPLEPLVPVPERGPVHGPPRPMPVVDKTEMFGQRKYDRPGDNKQVAG